jgi:MFS family permease
MTAGGRLYRPLRVQSGHADAGASALRPRNQQAWRALLIAGAGWLFDGYETFALILVGAPAIRDLTPAADLPHLPLYFAGLVAVTLVGWATGGLVGGVLTDYLGRRRMLMLSVVCYAVFTGLSAAAQTYWLLVLFRFLTGLGLGGEFCPGAALVGELWPPAQRGRAASALTAAFGVGSLLAAGLWFAIEPLGPGAWRYMFLIGILPAVLVLWMRRGLADPAAWVDADRRRQAARAAAAAGRRLSEAERQLARLTLVDLFARAELRRRTLLLLVMAFATIVGYWAVSTWIPQYANRVAERVGLTGGEWGARAGLLWSAGGIAGYLVLGLMADAWGRKRTIALFFAGSLVAGVAPFLVQRDLGLFLAAAAVNGFFTTGQFAWMAIYLPEVYPTALRGTGMAVVFNSARYAAALGPLAAGWLVESLGGIAQAAVIVNAVYLLGLAATPFAAPETRGLPLE